MIWKTFSLRLLLLATMLPIAVLWPQMNLAALCTVPRAEQVCPHFGQVDQSRDGVLVPHPINQEGLLLAFQHCAEGATDREIATTLNNEGYRADSIKRGANLFTKDTVRGILMSVFYLGYVAYKGTRIDAEHPALIGEELCNRAQEAGIGNRNSPKTQSEKRFIGRVYPLSGLLRCHECGGRIHGYGVRQGAYRCYTRSQRKGACSQAFVEVGVLEGQIGEYLACSQIPEDYQARIVESAGQDWSGIKNLEQTKQSLEGRLKRLIDLYEMGDKTREEYLRGRDEILSEPARLKPAEDRKFDLEQAAPLLGEICSAWAQGDAEQKRKIARLVFEEIRVENKQVVAIKPRPVFEQFCALDISDWRKRRDSNPRSSP